MWNKRFIIGIQWHPEISYDFDDNSRKIIDFFIEECKKQGFLFFLFNYKKNGNTNKEKERMIL